MQWGNDMGPRKNFTITTVETEIPKNVSYMSVT